MAQAVQASCECFKVPIIAKPLAGQVPPLIRADPALFHGKPQRRAVSGLRNVKGTVHGWFKKDDRLDSPMHSVKEVDRLKATVAMPQNPNVSDKESSRGF